MKTVLKYVKPFVWMIIISLSLLFAQAMCDLSLPNLMSDIVNTGIQNSGIDEAAPDRMSDSAMRLMTAFMTQQDKALFTGEYTLENGVYAANGEISAEAGAIYGKAAYACMSFVTEYAKENGMEVSDEDTGISEANPEKLYAVLPLLESYPEGELTSYAPADDADYSSMGTVFTGLFYRELGVDVNAIQRSYILKVGLEMLAVALAATFTSIGVGYLSARVGAGVSRDLRHAVFSKIESFTSSEYDKFSTASLITRTTNDVQQVQMLVTMGMRLMCYAPIMGIGGVVMALRKSSSLSWIIGVAVLIMMGIIAVLLVAALPKFTSLQKLIDKLNLVSRENLSGMMVIRAFGNENYEAKRFDAANRELSGTNRFVLRAMATLQPVMSLIMNGVTVAIVWVGAKAIEASTLQIGDMLAYLQYAMHIIISFLMIALMFVMVPRAAVSAKRIAEVLNTEVVIKEPKAPKKLERTAKNGRTVEFKDVSFRYSNADEDVVRDVSFVARPGETTAIIGATGSGKSTIVNLIMRFFDVTGGSVTIDDVDVRDLDTGELRAAVGYVPQKGVLFSGTVESNVRFGKEAATDGEVEEAIDTAQAAEFVKELDGGLEAPIAQGGGNVSGGQKQRLAIARALIKKAPIYIFDDSFSALDFKTDSLLRRALAEKTGDSTVIIVAQRVSTIMNAEQILVLDDGRLAGRGTHKELLQSCPAYKEIASSQLSAEELE